MTSYFLFCSSKFEAKSVFVSKTRENRGGAVSFSRALRNIRGIAFIKEMVRMGIDDAVLE